MNEMFCHFFWKKVPYDTDCACTRCHGERSQTCRKNNTSGKFPGCMPRSPESGNEVPSCDKCKKYWAQSNNNVK